MAGARFRSVVLDCPRPLALAAFYAAIVGGTPARPGRTSTRRVFADPAGHPFCPCRIPAP